MRKSSFKIGKFVMTPILIIIYTMLMLFSINSLVINAATPTGIRLKDIQDRALIGTEFPSGFTTMSDSSTFTRTAASEFNLVTAENAMKWDASSWTYLSMA